MRDQWRKLSGRFSALALRERVLVLVAAVVGTALLYNALVLRSLAVREQRLAQQLTEIRQSIKTADSLIKAQQAVLDPDAVRRSYRDALRQQLAGINADMQGLQRGLVPPERMGKLLEDMLTRSRGLQLVSLRTLPVRRFDGPGAASAAKGGDKTAKPAPGEAERIIYQHSFEITLRGSYAELYNYLTRLEELPWQMFWGRISVDTEQYPRLLVTVTVLTLSLNKAWLIV